MFNDEYIPEWITINRIWYNIFQSFSIDEITEDGGNSKRKASKVIPVDFSCDRRKLITKGQEIEFIKWLKGNNFEYSKLKLPNYPDCYYMAKIKNNIDIAGTLRRAKGTIEFLCIGNRIEEGINSINLNSNSIIYYS